MLGLVVKVSTYDDIVGLSIKKICTFSLDFQIFSGSQSYILRFPLVTCTEETVYTVNK